MMMTNFGAALALAAALALVSGEARAAEEITKQKCSITYRRSPTVHTECLVRFDMSQGFVSEEILMRTGKHWNRHGQMVSIKGGTTIEYDKKVPVSFGNPATVIHLSEWANFKPLKDLWKTADVTEEIINKHGLKTNDYVAVKAHPELWPPEPLKPGDDPITDKILAKHGLQLGDSGLAYFVPLKQ